MAGHGELLCASLANYSEGFSYISALNLTLYQAIPLVLILATATAYIFAKRASTPPKSRPGLSIVRPSKPDALEGRWEPLSGCDLLFAGLYSCFALRFNSQLDAAELKRALAQTLDQYPAASGRLQGDNIVNLTAGVEFEEIIDTETDVDSFTSASDWESVGAVLVRQGFFRPGPSEPLLKIRLSQFQKNDLSVLGVCFHHGLGDMHSVARFMLAWSNNCACGGKSACDEPQSLLLRRRLKFGAEDEKAPKSIAEYRAAAGSTLNGNTPIDRFPLLRVIPAWISSVRNHREMELRVDMERVQQLKKELFTNGEWVSTFEFIQSMLFYANARATGQGVGAPIPMYATINGRDRIDDHAANYFGNVVIHLRPFDLQFPKRDYNLPLEALAEIARNFHNSLQEIVKSDLAEDLKLLQSAVELGAGRRLYVPIIKPLLLGDIILMNAWNKFPLLDVNMGSPAKAAEFIPRASGTPSNLWCIFPYDQKSKFTTIHISMHKDCTEKFLSTIAEADFPITLVTPFKQN